MTMLIDDEQDLRAGLHALTAAPAPLRPGLAERSVRRAHAARVRRLGVSAVAVAAVAVAVPLAVPHPAPRPPAPLAESLLSWPDLRDPAWKPAADVALAEYLDFPGNEGNAADVRWLYAGEVPGSADFVAVAWAFCPDGRCTRVVLAEANREDALTRDGDPSSSSWGTHDGDVLPEAPQAPLAAYLPGRGARGATSVVLAVVPPGTTGVSWSAPALRAGTGGSGTLAPSGGVFVGDIGYLSAPARLSLTGPVPYEGPVALPGDEETQVGQAPALKQLTVPAPYERASAGSGQTDQPISYQDESQRGSRVVVVARCEGTAPLRATLNGRKARPLPCDGLQRTLFADQPARRPQDLMIEGEDPYASYAFAVGYR
jgi:hypothetical protein